MTTLFSFDETLSKQQKSIFEEVPTMTLPERHSATNEVFVGGSDLWHAICKMLSPLEYLLFNVNMIFLADSYFEYDCISRAANLLSAPETLHAINIMQDLQLMILLFFTVKLSLTASRVINFEIQEESTDKPDENKSATTILEQQ